MHLQALLDLIAALDSADDPAASLATVHQEIVGLSAADLARVETALVAAFDAIYGEDDAPRTPEQVSVLAGIGEATGAVRTRIAALGAAEEQAARLRDAVHPTPPPPQPVPPPPAGAATGVEDTGPDAGGDAGLPEPADPATTSGAGSTSPAVRAPVGAMSAHRPPAADPARRPQTAVAGRARMGAYMSATGSPHVRVGDAIDSWDTMGRLISDKLGRFGTRAFPREHVARWKVDAYPEERTLTGDPVRDQEKIDEVCSSSAIVASGGICTPVEVDYAIPTWGDDSRPLENALPSFNATRGGLRWVSSPKITDTVATASTSLWTEATDANPGGATKPHGVITCGTEQEVLVDAIPTIVQVGNMMARYSPEQVAAATKVVMTYAARFTELYLLGKITTASTTVLANRLLGVHRDVLATLDLYLARARYRARLPLGQRWRVLMPEFARDLIRVDVLREQAHDDAGTNIRAISDAQIESWFTARNCNITWLKESEPADGAAVWSGGPTPVSQQLDGAQTVAYLNGWPTELHWWIFPEGTFLRLDGGSLNLGVVRDHILNGTNDYQTFTEQFENVAFRGLESHRVISTVLPTGGSSLPIATSAAPSVLVGAASAAHGAGGSF